MKSKNAKIRKRRKKIRIKGNSNIVAGRDVNINLTIGEQIDPENSEIEEQAEDMNFLGAQK